MEEKTENCEEEVAAAFAVAENIAEEEKAEENGGAEVAAATAVFETAAFKEDSEKAKGGAEKEEKTAIKEGEKPGVFARLSAWCKKIFSTVKKAVSERGAEIEDAKKKRIWAGIGMTVFVLFLVAFYAVAGMTIVEIIKDPQWFKEWIDGFESGSVAIFIGLRVLMTVLRVLPGGALQIAGGYAFGTWAGALWCMVGSLIGTLIIFVLGKKFGMKLVGLFVSPEKMQSAGMLKDKKKRNLFLFLMNFLPGMPKDIFTWVAAVSADGTLSSIFVILLARIPSVVVSTWCGHALMQENYLLSAVVFGAMLVLGIGCSIAYKKFSAKHEKKGGEEHTKNGENCKDSEEK